MSTPDDELETSAVAAWPARVAEPLDGWVLRASDGFTRRANSVAVLGDGPADLDGAIARVDAFYAEHGLPPLFQVADTPRTEPTRVALARAGYVGDTDTVILTRPHVAHPSDPGTADGVVINDQPSDRWFDLWWSVDGRGSEHRSSARELFARMDRPCGFAERVVDGETVAVQLGVCDEDRVGLFCAATSPAARRQGHAGVVATALIDWATTAGTSSSYVQVMATNPASLALSEGLGYERSHQYRYWARPVTDA